MAKCKHCNAEIREMLDICPSCGKNPGVEAITSVMKPRKDKKKKERDKKKK